MAQAASMRIIFDLDDIDASIELETSTQTIVLPLSFGFIEHAKTIARSIISSHTGHSLAAAIYWNGSISFMLRISSEDTRSLDTPEICMLRKLRRIASLPMRCELSRSVKLSFL